MANFTQIPVKFHLEGNKVVFDEPITLTNSDMLIEEGVLFPDGTFRCDAIFIQRWEIDIPVNFTVV